MKALIVFRSGAQVTVDIASLEVAHDGPNKQISAIRWRDAEAGDLLLGIVPAEVAAVVALDRQPPEPPPYWERPHRYNHSPRVGEREHPSHPDMTCKQYHNQNEADRG